MQVAAQGNQEVYLHLASFSPLKTPVRFCLHSNGKCILHLCKKEQINPITSPLQKCHRNYYSIPISFCKAKRNRDQFGQDDGH